MNEPLTATEAATLTRRKLFKGLAAIGAAMAFSLNPLSNSSTVEATIYYGSDDELELVEERMLTDGNGKAIAIVRKYKNGDMVCLGDAADVKKLISPNLREAS